MLASVLFPVVSLQAHAGISITVSQPAPNGLSGDSLFISATVTSTYEVASVTAQVADRTANLAYSAGQAWTNTISLVGLSRGQQTLSVVATDVFGASNQVQQAFIHDVLPVLTVLEPLDYTVARPEVKLSAVATDDDPAGCVITVTTQGRSEYDTVTLASGTNHLEATLQGIGGVFTFTATDSVQPESSDELCHAIDVCLEDSEYFDW